MAEAVLPEVRAAQRRVISTVRVSGVLNSDGLALWRETGCGEWKATAAEIGRDLELLQVPYTTVTACRFPLANSRFTQLRRGEEVRIARKDLTHLVHWMPSLKVSIDSIRDEGPGWGFTIFQPKAEGMAVMDFALAGLDREAGTGSPPAVRRMRLRPAQARRREPAAVQHPAAGEAEQASPGVRAVLQRRPGRDGTPGRARRAAGMSSDQAGDIAGQ